jgi:hypothetical protein
MSSDIYTLYICHYSILICILLSVSNKMSSLDYDNVQIEDVEDEQDGDDSIEDYEEGAVAAAGAEDDDEEKSEHDGDDVGGNKTLVRELLDQYEDMQKKCSQLPSRKADRLTSRSIGITETL